MEKKQHAAPTKALQVLPVRITWKANPDGTYIVSTDISGLADHQAVCTAIAHMKNLLKENGMRKTARFAVQALPPCP